MTDSEEMKAEEETTKVDKVCLKQGVSKEKECVGR